jgi:hypothetical protein
MQTEQNLYLLMDFAAGGELFRLIREMHHLSEHDAKFYASEALSRSTFRSGRIAQQCCGLQSGVNITQR